MLTDKSGAEISSDVFRGGKKIDITIFVDRQHGPKSAISQMALIDMVEMMFDRRAPFPDVFVFWPDIELALDIGRPYAARADVYIRIEGPPEGGSAVLFRFEDALRNMLKTYGLYQEYCVVANFNGSKLRFPRSPERQKMRCI